MDRGKDLFYKRNKHADQEWSGNFFFLLLEMIQYWGKEKQYKLHQGSSTEYSKLYQILLKKGVVFPTETKFLDWPIPLPKSVSALDNEQEWGRE